MSAFALDAAAEYLKTGAAFREAYTGNVSVVSSSEMFRESAKTFRCLSYPEYTVPARQAGNAHSGILIFDIPRTVPTLFQTRRRLYRERRDRDGARLSVLQPHASRNEKRDNS